MSPRPPVHLALPLVAVGGAAGAGARELLLEAAPVHAHTFPWTIFAINVTGCALLALLPALPAVRRVRWMPVFLGTGVLGGFTTMSSAAVETMQLRDHSALAIGYLVGTLGSALLAVLIIDRLSTAAERELIAEEEGDE